MSELNRRVSTSIINLARWIGDGANKPLLGKPDISSISLDSSALDTELEHHPEIAVLSHQIKEAETEAQLAQANKKTDWSVEVAYAQRGSEFSDFVTVGISIPLQWDQKNRQDREESSKLAMVEQIKAEREELLRQHVGEIKAMVAEWQNGQERLARYTHEILPLATERTRATLAAYQGGKASLTELLLAHRNEIDIKQQAIQLEMDTARVWAQLNFLIPAGDAVTHQAIKDIQ
jgi:outer membrane protein TolC